MYTAIRFAASSTDEQQSRVHSRVRVAPRVFLDTIDGELLVRHRQRKPDETGKERVSGSYYLTAA
jgi:hypothetical protein